MLDNRKKNWGGRGSIEISIVKFKRRKVCKNCDDVDIFGEDRLKFRLSNLRGGKFVKIVMMWIFLKCWRRDGVLQRGNNYLYDLFRRNVKKKNVYPV